MARSFNGKLRLFGSWDLELCKMRPRTRLFNIPPFGIGTPYSESFTSYIARQARAHSVTPGALFTYELAPRTNKSYLLKKNKRGQSVLTTTFYPATPSLNGLGQTARDWVRVVEELNGRSDLRYLTLLPWTNVLTEKFLSRAVRAWCPECLEQRRSFGEEAYEQLLWTHQIVKICPLHQRRLESSCPSCGRNMRPLGDRLLPGFCSWCGGWLGNLEGGSSNESEQEDLTHESWIADQIGQLISFAPALASDPTKEMVHESLFSCINILSDGNLSGFARYFALNQTTAHSWRRRGGLPQTNLLLKICYKMGVSLFDFIVTGAYRSSDTWKSMAGEVRAQARRKYSRRDPKKVKSFLLAALKKKRPPSVAEVAVMLGYTTTCCINQSFPEICRQLRVKNRLTSPSKRTFTKHRGVRDIETLRRVLLEALDQECPPAIYALSRTLGHGSSYLLGRTLPDLCASIIERRAAWKRERKESIKRVLEAALIELPPPSLTKLGTRLGYSNGVTIGSYFPGLCKLISERQASYAVRRRTEICEELKRALREAVPPTMHQLEVRFDCDFSYLNANFPDQCRLIAKRRVQVVKRLSLMRKQKARRQIKQIAKRLYANDIYPSAARVRAKLSKEIGAGEVWGALREVRRELGLPHTTGEVLTKPH